jgi:hypothetical protein
MAQIIITANVVIPSGPKLAFNQKLDVEAYDLIEVTVPAGTAAGSAKEIELPASTGGVAFFAVKSDWYGDDLKYALESGGTEHALDQPLVLTGTGAVAFFVTGTAVPSSLFFSNANTTDDAKVQILIGRDATP